MKHLNLLKILYIIASESHCNKNKVGAILTREGRIIATGYNGTVSGVINDCEDNSNNTKDQVVHAEQNVISFCSKNGISTDGTTIFISLSPCVHCAKLLIQSGITEVYYSEEYRCTLGKDLLMSKGISCRRIS